VFHSGPPPPDRALPSDRPTLPAIYALAEATREISLFGFLTSFCGCGKVIGENHPSAPSVGEHINREKP
jgi:hypothetical protein